MPRPGPRPYECVKRAWHSDRHQPVRGSLIREIFRVANEIHNPATRKNREWQEKLPSVVLKAEEIMYSKANSEAEYVDLNTLWERANDAIDTIIRRDNADESGNLLQPCIEGIVSFPVQHHPGTKQFRRYAWQAAQSHFLQTDAPVWHSCLHTTRISLPKEKRIPNSLSLLICRAWTPQMHSHIVTGGIGFLSFVFNVCSALHFFPIIYPFYSAALTLGCIPRRASRSQRHCNPRCYLSATPQEATKPSTSSHNILNSNSPQLGPAPYLLQPSLLACPGNLQNCSTQCTSWFPTMACPPTPGNSFHLELRLANVVPSISPNGSVPVACSATRFESNDCLFYKQDNALLGTCKQATLGCVYPLYYGAITQNVESCSSFLEPLGSSCNDATIGSVAYGSSARELDVNIFPSYDTGRNASNEPLTPKDTSESAANAECDLSLHLGLRSRSSLVANDGWAPEVEDMGSSSSLDSSKFHEPSQNQARSNIECFFPSPQDHRGLFFLHMEGPSEPLESCSSKRSLEDEDTLYVETSVKKTKTQQDDSIDFAYFRWKQTPPARQQFYRSDRPD